VNRFAGALIAEAAKKLGRRLRRKLDAEDVVQSAWASFFRRYADGQFEVKDWSGLWGLLVSITVCKTLNKVKEFNRQARDIKREDSSSPPRKVRRRSHRSTKCPLLKRLPC